MSTSSLCLVEHNTYCTRTCSNTSFSSGFCITTPLERIIRARSALLTNNADTEFINLACHIANCIQNQKPATAALPLHIETRAERGERRAILSVWWCAFVACICNRANFLDLSLMHPGFYPVFALTVRWLLFAVCRFVSDVRFTRFFVVPSSFHIVGYLFAVRPLRNVNGCCKARSTLRSDNCDYYLRIVSLYICSMW